MTLNVVQTKGISIEKQLKLESDLLKNSSENWVLINEGTDPAIVMGVLGKEEELIDKSALNNLNMGVFRRFSGGGTVVVDENTIFVTFIFQKEVHSFVPFPENIMNWSGEIYKEVFGTDQFSVRENDYVLGERKCGGNAQYIKKERWLHHTSFLWDFSKDRMNALLFPKKVPNYRKGRSHEDFLCKIKDHFSSKTVFIEKIKDEIGKKVLLGAG